ncbi:hypothetical protein CBS101457_005363 [Exobasidium rhododendri]|nr:hypothetical protein CBS101457_005363 [Exobasidium rhododendri]
MARTTRKKGGAGQATSPSNLPKQEYIDGLSSHPPPPPELDPSGAAGYASYGSHGGDYVSHDLISNGDSPGRGGSPHAGRAYFPAGAPGSSDYALEDHNQHIQQLPPLSEALHSESDGQHYPHSGGAYETSHHNGASTHSSFDHNSSNFFDPQIMDAPPSATEGGRHGSLHHAGNGNGHFHGSIMTPPPPSSSHGYASSPYQVGQGSAPHMFHRASISGPVMHSHYPPPPGTPTPLAHPVSGGGGAPPQAGDMAAWGTPSGSARPHTADGMFGSQMSGMPQQWGGSMGGPIDYNRGPRGSNASLNSMSDAPPGSAGGKVFSYMAGGEDDGSSIDGSGSQSGGGSRKRPRRRYDEIERLYPCSWLGCQKSYGTLNHLNAHVAMQKHGAKRSPGEFKDMRKAWRKSKREDEQRRQANQAAANEEVLSRSKMMFPSTSQPFMAHGYSVNNNTNNFGPPPPHVMPPPGQIPRYAVHPQASMYGSPSGYHMAVDAAGRPYSSTGQQQQQQHQQAQQHLGQSQQVGQSQSGLGAYLMAHRGSI